MSCSCSISTEIDCLPDLYEEKKVVARKDHVCCECRKTIKRGQPYERIKGLWEGKFETYKTCIDCLSVRKAFFESYIFGELYDSLYEEIADADGELSQTCISKLTPVARGKVCDMINDWWTAREEEGLYD